MTPLHVGDLAGLLLRVPTVPGAEGRAFVARGGEPLPARDPFARHVGRLGRADVLPAPAVLRTGAAAADAADRARGRMPDVTPAGLRDVPWRGSRPCARAREEPGWAPRVALHEGMARALARARAEGLPARG